MYINCYKYMVNTDMYLYINHVSKRCIFIYKYKYFHIII